MKVKVNKEEAQYMTDKQCEACEQGLHDKCIAKVEIPMLRDKCWCGDCNIENNNKVLDKMDKEMVDLQSAQDWGNSFLQIKLRGAKHLADRIEKLSDTRKDDIDTILSSALRQIEDIIDYV